MDHPLEELDFGERYARGRYETVLSYEMMDGNGHLNYADWISYLHRAHILRLTANNHMLGLLRSRGLKLFMKKNEFEYKAEAKAGDTFAVDTDLELGKTSITLPQKIYVNGSLAGEAKWVVVVIGKNSKPFPIPEDVRKLLKEE